MIIDVLKNYLNNKNQKKKIVFILLGMKYIWVIKYNNNKRLDIVFKCWMFIYYFNIVIDKDII